MNYANLRAWLAMNGTGDDEADAAALRTPTQPTVGAVLLTPDEFVERFTPSEFMAAQTSSDAVVRQLMFRLAVRREPLSLSSVTVQGGLAYMANIGLLTSDRAESIGAITPGPNVATCVLLDCALMLEMDDRSAALTVAQAREA